MQYVFVGIGVCASLFEPVSHAAVRFWAPYLLLSHALYTLAWIGSAALLRYDHNRNLGPAFFLYLFWVVLILKNVLEGLSWRNGQWFRYILSDAPGQPGYVACMCGHAVLLARLRLLYKCMRRGIIRPGRAAMSM